MKISSIVDYLALLLKKYNEIQQIQMTNTFRVSSIKYTTDGGVKIIFQVIGKSTFMDCSLDEILSNDVFLEQFSKKDIQMITYAHAQLESIKKQQTTDHRLKLVRQEFNICDEQIQFTLKDQKGCATVKTAAEIYLDKALINHHLAQKDAVNIAYVAGFEHGQNDSTTN
jgi:hypothetical protein